MRVRRTRIANVRIGSLAILLATATNAAAQVPPPPVPIQTPHPNPSSSLVLPQAPEVSVSPDRVRRGSHRSGVPGVVDPHPAPHYGSKKAFLAHRHSMGTIAEWSGGPSWETQPLRGCSDRARHDDQPLDLMIEVGLQERIVILETTRNRTNRRAGRACKCAQGSRCGRRLCARRPEGAAVPERRETALHAVRS